MNISNDSIKQEALSLAEEILKNIEMSNLPLTNIALRASRLARLVNDIEQERIFEYEAGGYPTTPQGVPPEIWKLGKIAGRVKKGSNGKEQMSLESIFSWESLISTNTIALECSSDPNVSIASANPQQIIFPPGSNKQERIGRTRTINDASRCLAQSRSFIYSYVKNTYYSLKFSNVTESVWLRIKHRIDDYISDIIPDETRKLAAIYDSLNDDNPEKWATALTSCRRMLKALADKLYPSSDVPVKRNGRDVKIGEEQYINRLICYIEDNTTHETLDKITNSNLKYIGERLDNIHSEACKGTHATVDKEEAERCFMHAYMLVGDILEIERQKTIALKVPNND